MQLNAFLKRFIGLQNQFQNRIGHATAWLSLTLVLITALVVVLRYGFNTGSVALQESIMYNHAILFMLGMAYTYAQDQHVRVDVFYSQFSAQRKAWVNLIGSLLFALPVVIFIFLSSWDYVSASWAIKEASTESGGIAYLYMLKSLILVMSTLLMLQSLAVMANAYLHIIAEQPTDLPADTEAEGKL
ncbi:TRAP transporter small permease subunit [Thiomicrorhabdus sediminis]|uniref:TRAP transporter small permease protein n=1 Tax=Thiomicrorhabdus sediminis TaxID=2580412 RepID=A0A4P9K346_9GAMM|nr:TRAP transporter small permease subunit [Thiomicrorhabdus sediminis]QCU89259.1 TRAP transporter small permease subunit [Thiomicrorhabdus sediminis]